jgi:hypothetical protein
VGHRKLQLLDATVKNMDRGGPAVALHKSLGWNFLLVVVFKVVVEQDDEQKESVQNSCGRG